jgi:CPA1 family monovalent cation:H+ antiporter
MSLLEILVTVVSTVVVVLAVRPLSARTGINAALLLTALGIAASFLPFVHVGPLEPDLVLLVLLPPILYSAAINVSLADFRADIKPILRLSVGLVVFTAFLVAGTAWALFPIGFAAALALGAVVGPPDAVAALAIGRKLGLPRRLMTLLEGESLVNDATALVLLTTAISALSSQTTAGGVTLSLLLSAGGGAIVGVVVGFIVNRIHAWTSDSTISVGLSLITPWIAFLPAEEIHASGVLAVVLAGLIIGHKAPVLQSATARLSQSINWRTIAFLLENAVFFIIGLQSQQIFDSVLAAGHGGWQTWVACAVIYLVTVGARFIWVFGSSGVIGRFLGRRRRGQQRLSWQQSVVLSFAGMRGVVTLASVFLIPAETPYRDVLVLAALFVTVASLLVQGLTMPWLVARLGVAGPGVRTVILQEAHIMQRLSAVGIKKIKGMAAKEGKPESDADEMVLERLVTLNEARANRVWERLGRHSDGEAPSHLYRRYRLAMIKAQRGEALSMRNERSVDFDVLQRVLGALDVEEASLQAAEGTVRETEEETVSEVSTGERCVHLVDTDNWDPVPLSDVCEDCEREGLVPVHLRLCMQCGYVGCCDSSPGRHMTAHFHATGHPVLRSFEPGEAWRWCNVDHQLA